MKLLLLLWSLHKMTNAILVKKFVTEVLLSANADIIVLTEYLTDEIIIKALSDKYWLEESNTKSGNKILIAVKKEVAPKGVTIINKNEINGACNFCHVDVELIDEKILSIIGMRMISPIDASIQTPPLVSYLSNLLTPFICTGDYNIKRHRMSCWFPGVELSDMEKAACDLAKSSIVYTNKDGKIVGFGAVDHVLHSSDVKAKSKYSWDYLSKDSVYPCIEDVKIGGNWKIPAAFPDHALVLSSIEI